MDREIQRVVAPDFLAAERVVEREGCVYEGAAGGRAAIGGREKNREGIETTNRGIFHDRTDVVEEEGNLNRVRVGEHEGEDKARRSEPTPREGAWGGFTAGGDNGGHGWRAWANRGKEKAPSDRGS